MNYNRTGPSLPQAPAATARRLRHHDSPALSGTATRDIKSPLAGPGGGGGTSPGGGTAPGGGGTAGTGGISIAIESAQRPLR